MQKEVDLIEEVARLHGYDKIPTTLPSGAITQGRRTERQRIIKKTRDTLTSCGLTEVINYSFINPLQFDKLRLAPDNSLRRAIPLANPLSEDQSVMRTVLTGSLLETISYNNNRNEQDLWLYELGSVYLPNELPLLTLPEEKTILGLAITGSLTAEHWRQKTQPADFFDLKGVVEKLMERLGIQEVSFAETDKEQCQPGQCAAILVKDRNVGWIGSIHPEVLKAFSLEKAVISCELDMDRLLAHSQLITKFKPLPRYPALLRDLAVVVPDHVTAAQVFEVIREAGGSMVNEVSLFDLYRGPQVPDGSRSLAFAVTYRDHQKTLNDEEVELLHQKTEKSLQEKLGVTLRR